MGEVEAINRIVLPGQRSQEGPAIPESFRAQLRQYDPDLLVAWNHIKKRFVIEQCVQHAGGPEHTHVCGRNFVVLAQDDDGVMLPLGDRVMEKIKAADVTRAGYGPEDLAKFLKDQKAVLAADRKDREQKSRDAVTHGSRFNRRQLLKAKHLIDQHNLTVNQ